MVRASDTGTGRMGRTFGEFVSTTRSIKCFQDGAWQMAMTDGDGSGKWQWQMPKYQTLFHTSRPPSLSLACPHSQQLLCLHLTPVWSKLKGIWAMWQAQRPFDSLTPTLSPHPYKGFKTD